MLFYENMLSRDGSKNCVSCHRQEHAFSDTTRFSFGVEMLLGKRQEMSVFNMAWNNNEFF
jgi:cytochrome c peroxidase